MIEFIANPGQDRYSAAKKIGELLATEFKKDPHFYFFSPDETTSNKFDQIFNTAKRAWGNLPQEKWDLPESSNGRIIEMLSENVLFSIMTGHLSNGERAMMGSYEAFYPIITAQLLQQIKFIKQSKLVPWRKPLPAINLLSTSTCWRQDHNGFTHQSPTLISTLLSVPSGLTNCIFPIDDVAAETAYRFMIESENVVNLTTFDKNERPRYIDSHHAEYEFENGGASIYQFVSDDNPDYVFVACGDIVAHEAIEAIKLLKSDMPGIRLRFIYLNSLCYNGIGTTNNGLTPEQFNDMFTLDKPIIAIFHGYPQTLETILAHYTNLNRVSSHGFMEEGSTTTPFEMLRRNKASRYDLAYDVARLAGNNELALHYMDELEKNHSYALAHGIDMIE